MTLDDLKNSTPVERKRTLEESEKYISELEKEKCNMLNELLEANGELEECEKDNEDLEHEIIRLRKDCILKDGIIHGLTISLEIIT